MASMGVSFKDSQGNMLPFGQVLEQLSIALKKSGGNMDQVAFLADLVGLRGQKAASNLKDLFMSGKVGELVKELEGARGSAEKMANLRMQNLKGDIELLGGAVDSLKIKLFQTESGPLRDIVRGMTAWIEKNDRLIKSEILQFLEHGKFAVDAFGRGMREGFDSAMVVVNALLGPLKIFDGLIGNRTWPENVRALGQAFGFLAVVTAGFLAYTVAVKAARVATVLFGIATKAVRIVVLGFQLAMKGLRAAIILYQIASRAGVGGTIALSLASRAATIDMIAARAAALGAAAGFKAMAIAGGAVAAAVASILVAWDQWNQLLAQTQGFEGVLAGIGALLNGESFFKGVDDFMNEKARAEFELQKQTPPTLEIKPPDFSEIENHFAALTMPEIGVVVPPPLEVAKPDPLAVQKPLPQIQIAKPAWVDAFEQGSGPAPGTPGNFFGAAPPAQVVPPSAAPPVSTTETKNTNTTDKAEITIKSQGGKATVTKKPRGNTKVNVAPSGGF
jgi:hypothetical protein